jgi:titin
MATFAVSNTLDSGVDSLRDAITQSNATSPGPNTIDFSIPTSDPGYDSSTGVWTISLLSALPCISVPVTIDGTSQTMSYTVPVIDLDGTGAGAGSNGLTLGAGSGGSQVLGLMIENFANAGIDVASANNTIGDAAAGVSNVISGNTGDGVEISGSGTTGNLVAGNFIGTDVTGTAAVGNGWNGVLIDASASGNTIGGTTAAARNIVSANVDSGVTITGANDNVVEGDYIGTDVTGTAALANAAARGYYTYGGVFLYLGASGNTIGGLTASPGTGAGNLISGNDLAGVTMNHAGAFNLVAGNLIGTNVTGSVALPNTDLSPNFGGDGIAVYYSPDTIVGEPGGRNVIAGNGLGIVNSANVFMQSSNGTVIQSNFIGTDITGTIALSTHSYYGILYQYGSYTIGGLTPIPGTGLGNVISGNGAGIVNFTGGLSQILATPIAIEGNIIGADVTGEHALPNVNVGIALTQVSQVTIGGTAAGAANLISGNHFGGEVALVDCSNDVVEGNDIGTDITGEALLSGSSLEPGAGVIVGDGSTDITIGGTTAMARNIISGNNGDGVYIGVWKVADLTTSSIVVEGNLIGTDATGTVALANAGSGVEVGPGGTGNTIGGTVGGSGNVISGNASSGVQIGASTGLSGFTGSAATGNLVAVSPPMVLPEAPV